MDDYNISAIYEAKNEYSARLIDIVTPLVIEGIKSIFKEALELCIVNDEKEKYLMTFQNFLTRVPKWNQSIINVESERIVKKSGCLYLDDLISCVHISQLKILTSIRVSNKQKKVEIEIPKVNDFIHGIYIKFARKLYSNVYLFETTISPLQIQKNNRECELICKECILNVIRENIPVDKILRAYIDETEEEEIITEVLKKSELVDQNTPIESVETSILTKPLFKETPVTENIKKNTSSIVVKKETKSDNKPYEVPLQISKLTPPSSFSGLNIGSTISSATKSLFNIDTTKENKLPSKLSIETPVSTHSVVSSPLTNTVTPLTNTVTPLSNVITPLALTNTATPLTNTATPLTNIVTPLALTNITPEKNRISFTDTDEVKEYNVASSPRSSSTVQANTIIAPKNIQRLEEISEKRNQERKDEEAEDDDEKIKIFSNEPSSLLKIDALEIETLPSFASSSGSTSPTMKLNTSELNIETLN